MPINRRHLIAGLAVAAARPVAATAATPEPNTFRDDYALARKSFRTNLLERGPAPDKPQPLSPPPGVRAVQYRSGALDLVGWMSEQAAGKTPRPGVLVLHGGNALWHGHWDLARPYVDAGFRAMMPALRAENGLPGSFSGFYDETSDVLAATDVLRAQPGVDPERLFVAGHSIGGTLTLLAAMSTTLFRAAASYSSAPDARAFFRHYPEDIRFDTADPLEYDMRSAVAFAPSFKCPILMLHGSEEHHSDAAIRLTVERARAAGKTAHRGVIEGNHTSAIPGETAESLRFFAGI